LFALIASPPFASMSSPTVSGRQDEAVAGDDIVVMTEQLLHLAAGGGSRRCCRNGFRVYPASYRGCGLPPEK
jgi:hypothetical protein